MPFPFLLRCHVAALLAGWCLFAAGEEPVPVPAAAEAGSALTPRILYKFLLAEIAAHRGKLQFSAAAYLDLAKATRDPRIARRATEVAFYAREPETALRSARLWAEIEPESADAKHGLWTLLAATGRNEELAGLLNQALAGKGTDTGSALLELGRMVSRFPDKPAALHLLMQVSAPYDALPETHFIRAQAAWAAQETALARASSERALALKPDWEEAVLLQAQLQSPDSAKAAEILADFLVRHPEAREVRLAMARALVDAKRYTEAQQVFLDLLKEAPDNVELLYPAGLLSLELGDLAAGEAYLKRVLELGFSDMDSVRYYLGHGAEEAGRQQEALEYFDAVSEKSPRYVPAQARAANLLRTQGRLDEARSRLQKAAAAAPPAERAPLILAESRLLIEAHRQDEAVRVLESALAALPDDPALLYESAMLAEKFGKHGVFESRLRRVIRLRPDGAEAYNALGYSLADRNIRLDEAQKLIEKALSLAPQDAAIIDSRGWLAYRRGDQLLAVKLLRKALAIRPDPEIAAHLGEVLWVQGRHDEARQAWDEAIRAFPDNEVLSATIRRLAP